MRVCLLWMVWTVSAVDMNEVGKVKTVDVLRVRFQTVRARKLGCVDSFSVLLDKHEHDRWLLQVLGKQPN